LKKYIIDTNILTFAMGDYYKTPRVVSNVSKIVIGALTNQFTPVISKKLVDEYARVLGKKPLPNLPEVNGKPRPPSWYKKYITNSVAHPDYNLPRIPGMFYTRDDNDFFLLCLSVDMQIPIVTHNLKDFPEDGRDIGEVLSIGDFLARETSVATISAWP
jgi:hypothetical protein